MLLFSHFIYLVYVFTMQINVNNRNITPHLGNQHAIYPRKFGRHRKVLNCSLRFSIYAKDSHNSHIICKHTLCAISSAKLKQQLQVTHSKTSYTATPFARNSITDVQNRLTEDACCSLLRGNNPII